MFREVIYFIVSAVLVKFSCYCEVSNGQLSRNNEIVPPKIYDVGEQRNTAGNFLPYSPNNRYPYMKPDVYDYSYDFNSFFNRIKQYPQTAVTYYPFSLQNIDEYGYAYPRIYNRPYPYASHLMSKNYSPQQSMEVPVQDDQVPFYRDAANVNSEPLNKLQVVKRLVPIGYTTEIVSPRENNIASASSEYPNVLLPNTYKPVIQPIQTIPVLPQLNYLPFNQENPANHLFGYNSDLVGKTLAYLENINSTTLSNKSEEFRQRVELVIHLLDNVPAFANEFYQCLSSNKILKDIMEKTQKVTKLDAVEHNNSGLKKIISK